MTENEQKPFTTIKSKAFRWRTFKRIIATFLVSYF